MYQKHVILYFYTNSFFDPLSMSFCKCCTFYYIVCGFFFVDIVDLPVFEFLLYKQFIFHASYLVPCTVLCIIVAVLLKKPLEKLPSAE